MGTHSSLIYSSGYFDLKIGRLTKLLRNPSKAVFLNALGLVTEFHLQ